MLIEFRVRNFRSIRDEQVLSLVATRDKTLARANTRTTGINAVPVLLNSAAIYGPNAGGKSNLIKAIQYMRGVVVESATIIQPGQGFSVQPFRLDSHSSERPTEFEVTLIVDGVRYQYGFAMNPQRIVSEHLLVYKAFKPQLWFERTYDASSEAYDYKWGHGLKGQKAVWEAATRPNSLFLSMAVQLNSELLRPLFDWFANRLLVVNELAPLNALHSIAMVREADGRRAMCKFLEAADMSISDIDVITSKVYGQQVQFDLVSGKTEVTPSNEMEQNELRFHHVTDQGKAIFGLQDESNGTRALFFWGGSILGVLKRGVTLVVDELDTSMHTLLVRHLVRLFHAPDANGQGAQLVFTTHDTSLLDADLFRRDQIWFVEKNRDQASSVFALAEFSPRKNEALERGYLMGRFGALPLLGEMTKP